VQAAWSRDLHLAWFHPDGVPDCACEKSFWFFAKKGMRFCRCSKKRKGRPKLGAGICADIERATVIARRRWRRALFRLRRDGWDEF
jgi:hypothetical protein